MTTPAGPEEEGVDVDTVDDVPPADVDTVDAVAPDDAAPDVGDGERPWSWHLIRVTGVFLAVLVPLHFAVVVIGGDVGATNAGTIVSRFHNDLWRAVEGIVVVLALTHGFFAIRANLLASSRSDRFRDWGIVGLGVGCVLLAIAALAVLLTF
jgi:succinate dehydrogenase hydrophobic anchor subunit